MIVPAPGILGFAGGAGIPDARTLDRRGAAIPWRVEAGGWERTEMEREAIREAGALVLTFDGIVDWRNARSFREAVLGAVEDGDRGVVVDLREVSHFGSAGIRALLDIDRHLARRDTPFVVSVSDLLSRVFEIGGFDRCIRFRRSRSEALDEMEARLRAAPA